MWQVMVLVKDVHGVSGLLGMHVLSYPNINFGATKLGPSMDGIEKRLRTKSFCRCDLTCHDAAC